MNTRTRLRAVMGLARLIGGEVSRLHLPFLAASLAYYAFVSLLPVLLFLLVVVSILGGEIVAASVADLAAAYLTPQGQQLIVNAFESAADETSVSVVGVAVLLWSTFRIFRGLSIAFEQVYRVPTERSLLGQVRDTIVVSLALGVALITTVTAGTAFALFRDLPYLGTVSPLVLIGWLALVLLPIYYIFPPIDVSVREALPGAVVAAVGWASLEVLFGIYLATVGQYQIYGIVGGILLFVTWLYVGALILLVGVVVNAVLAGRIASRDLDTPEQSPERTRGQPLWDWNR